MLHHSRIEMNLEATATVLTWVTHSSSTLMCVDIVAHTHTHERNNTATTSRNHQHAKDITEQPSRMKRGSDHHMAVSHLFRVRKIERLYGWQDVLIRYSGVWIQGPGSRIQASGSRLQGPESRV